MNTGQWAQGSGLRDTGDTQPLPRITRISRKLFPPSSFIPHPSSFVSPFVFRLSSFVCLIALAACSSLGPPVTPTPLPPATATPSTNEDPQGTAATFLDLWRQGDYAGMYTLL